MARITTIDALREVIPAPSPAAFAKIGDRLCAQAQEFLGAVRFVVLGTVGEWGLELSQKGGPTGFVRMVDERTLLIPEFAGNQFALALSNILADPRVGLTLMRPGTDEVLRVSGRASLHRDAELCERLAEGGKPALLAIRIDIDRAAFHCVRSSRRAGLWEPASWSTPMRVSFGRIYAEALARPEVESLFDEMTQASNAKLY